MKKKTLKRKTKDYKDKWNQILEFVRWGIREKEEVKRKKNCSRKKFFSWNLCSRSVYFLHFFFSTKVEDEVGAGKQVECKVNSWKFQKLRRKEKMVKNSSEKSKGDSDANTLDEKRYFCI